ncbi:MarR family transcriptional regulator [Candidatus Saccharibacteria bacterium]|jgi:DNA-binding MarR family transcriptional regulator|nr:MarR family transcriptional regulator [Candidatus Saccharibacteria bacterium]
MSDRELIVSEIIEDFEMMHRSILRHSNNEVDSLPIGQRMTLHIIAAKKSVNVKELSSILKITPGAATQQIEALVQRDLIVRSPNSNDRRISLLSLTSKGVKYYDKTVRKRRTFVAEIFCEIPTDELIDYKNTTNKICEELDKMRNEE